MVRLGQVSLKSIINENGYQYDKWLDFFAWPPLVLRG